MLHLSSYKGMVGRAALIGALMVGAMVVFLMGGGLGEGQERCPAAFDECIEYPEEGSGAVIVFTALDPEEEDVDWDLSEADAALFDISEGRLTFKSSPDYESPGSTTSSNVYIITIEAEDKDAGLDAAFRADTDPPRPVKMALQVTVTNVDEAGEVSLPTLQPQEDVSITATLTDADGKIRNDAGVQETGTDLTAEGTTKWQWSRSTRATGGWTNVEDDDSTEDVVEGTGSSYTPTEDDVGMYLRVRATYADGEGEGKSAEAISANPVQADPSNDPPMFLDEDGKELMSTTRSVAENSEVGTAVGEPVTATDPGFDGRQETLTYSLTVVNTDFDIDSGTGQIRVKAALDYEDTAQNTQTVTVKARDPSGAEDTITVNITVTNVDEAPVFTAGSTSVDYNEDAEFGTEAARYVAEDPDGDNDASLKWSLSGRDAAAFAIGNRAGEHGRLTFREAPDYEAPTDSDRDNVYEVTVEVTDRGGSKATRDVTVHVENVDEEGLLTVSSLYPQIGTRITPTLTDPDTPISNLIWTWEIGGNVESRANAYIPKAADINRSLAVSVTYTDGTGERQTLSVESEDTVGAQPSGVNQSPRFPTSTLTRRTIRENEPVGEEVGGEVMAEDPDNDNLTYSISGGDGAFSIEQDTGQIITRASLDREKRSSYRVTVTAEDPSGARDTLSLTIAVEDVDEPPSITSGDVYIYYAENGRGAVAAYRAEDPEGRSTEWSLTGTDEDAFSFDRGVLRFRTPPDYEDGNTYSVRVNAGDGNANNTSSEDITIVVTNVDEKGKVEFNQEPRENALLTATLTDPDGTESGQVWQWARSSSRSGGFTDIQGGTGSGNTSTYTPGPDDTGMYLRATVTYTDEHGGGKSAHVTSTRRTEWKASLAPVFPETTPTRSVEENAGSGTNVGAPVAATDIGDRGIPEKLTYGLSDATDGSGDANAFDIDQRTGQIKVSGMENLEYEVVNAPDDRTYNVKVTATDPSNKEASIDVTITVTNVDEPPVLTLPALAINRVGVGDGEVDEEVEENRIAEFTHAEPVGENPTLLRLDFMADDPEKDDNPTVAGTNNVILTWTLAGTDAEDFEIEDDPITDGTDDPGRLRFKETPDYENPTDSGRNNVYEVTVQVSDEAGNMASQRVRITVENVDEDGVITLSHPQPEVGRRLTATLTDPDTARSPSYKWYRGVSADSLPGDDAICTETLNTNCLISSARSSSYTPSIYPDDNDDGTHDNTDVDATLTVVASYRDGYSTERSASETTAAVRDGPPENDRNDPPVFSSPSAEVAVREDANPGDPVGDVDAVGTPSQVTATDIDTRASETLAYSLSTGDTRFFTIDAISEGTAVAGQIRVRDGIELDYETKDRYIVTVKAEDPSGASDTIRVTIHVLDVDETPVLSRTGLVAVGRGSISYPENGRDRVGDYSALGPNAGSVSWRLSGTDASDFSINSRGALSFRSTPNFESPADSDKDNRYELTVTARSGRDLDSLDVMVDVYNVDEEGEVKLTPTRGTIGARITAELTDPDGAVTGVSWEWERSETGLTGWTPIPGTNSDSYILDAEDRGYYVQATAYYSDFEGGGKSTSARTTAAVLADDDGRVTLSADRVAVGDSVTARLTDPDGNIRNLTWQWASSEISTSGWLDIPGATSSTYTAADADVGNFLRATASYDDGDGTDKSAEAVTTSAVLEDDDGEVTLSSTAPSVGETVTATLTDPDDRVTRVSWQWASSSTGTSNWTNIAGATSETYTVVSGNLNNYLRATVVYDDAAGPGKSAEAVTTAAVAEDDDGSVTLSPTGPSDGDLVTATLTDPDGGVTGITWTWASSSNGTTGWTNILNATSATYTPITTDVGRYLRATVTYTDAVGPGKSAEAVTAAAVTADDDGRVTLSDTMPTVGDTVTARIVDPDGGVTGESWQWAISPNGTSNWVLLLNATSSSYTPTAANVGSYLRASASYTDAVGPGKSANAVTAAAVAPDDDGVVTLSTGAPEVGSEITASLSDPDGGVTGETWQWAKSSNGTTGWTNIDGATLASYTPGRSDAGLFLRATASYDDSVGTGKSAQAVTSSGVAQMALLRDYDANRNGRIERIEAVQAVSDYFNGQISKADVLDVLVLYFSG